MPPPAPRRREPELKTSLLAAGALALCCLLEAQGPARAQTMDLDEERLAWRRLEYEASKLNFRIEASVEISPASPSELGAALVEPGAGSGVPVWSGEALLLEIESRGLGRESLVDFWFRPDAAALQRRQLETGSKARRNRFKIARFTDRGVFSVTRRPTDEEVSRPHEEWSERSENFEPYPGGVGTHGPISEPSVIFYAVSAASLEGPGDAITLPLLSKGQVVLVTLRVRGLERIKVRYEESSPSGSRRIDRHEDVLAVSLESRPVEAGGGGEELRFMGLGGDVVLYLEPERRIPVRISGRVKYAGKAHLKLRRVGLS